MQTWELLIYNGFFYKSGFLTPNPCFYSDSFSGCQPGGSGSAPVPEETDESHPLVHCGSGHILFRPSKIILSLSAEDIPWGFLFNLTHLSLSRFVTLLHFVSLDNLLT